MDALCVYADTQSSFLLYLSCSEATAAVAPAFIE